MELFEYNFTGQAITSLELFDLHKAKQTLLQLQVSKAHIFLLVTIQFIKTFNFLVR
jgi:hypothetical protein